MLSAKPWRPEAVCLFVAAQFFCFLSGGISAALLQKAGVTGFKDLYDFGSVFLETFCFQGMTCILMGFFFRFHGLAWRDALGFGQKNLPFALLLALGAVIIVLPLTYWLQGESSLLMQKMHWIPKDEPAVTLVTSATSRAEEVYLGFYTIVLVPIAEEFTFRGLLFPFVKQLGFPKIAWLGVSLLFALIHWNLPLTWLYDITDNLMAPIFAHALFNVAGFVLLKYYPQ
jgi:membrane protease YdiL (CAAX protease family)